MAPASTLAQVGSYVCARKLRSTKTLEVWQSHRADAGPNGPCFLVKRLLPELAEDPRLVEQFVLRGQRAKRLCHPGIASVVDLVVEAEDCCIVSEALDGQTLRELLDRLCTSDNALPVWFSVHVAYKLSLALEHAHHGRDGDAIHHQDVSPENVTVTRSGEVKLVDFGLSRSALLDTNAVGIRRWSDCAEFELSAPHFGDAQTDIQGLGHVLYALLTGRAPKQRAVPPSHLVAWVSPELDLLVARMLAASGADRFANVREVRASLAELVQRQRQPVDSSHLAGLLGLVTSSFPQPEQPELRGPESIDEMPSRSMTILTAPAVEAVDADAATPDLPPLSHDWDAAVTRAKTDSQQPPRPVESVDPSAATQSFERGIEKLKHGDLLAAEAEWLRALELDPNHRLSQVNLKRLRKLRDSEAPAAIR